MIQIKEITIKNIYAFIQGNFRYLLYYSNFKFLIRKHIREQIELRIKVMDRVCYNSGSCKICGCKTTALQMANKSCAGNCYPILMNKLEWNFFTRHVPINKTLEDMYKYLAKYPEYFTIDLKVSFGPYTKRMLIQRISKENEHGNSSK